MVKPGFFTFSHGKMAYYHCYKNSPIKRNLPFTAILTLSSSLCHQTSLLSREYIYLSSPPLYTPLHTSPLHTSQLHTFPLHLHTSCLFTPLHSTSHLLPFHTSPLHFTLLASSHLSLRYLFTPNCCPHRWIKLLGLEYI